MAIHFQSKNEIAKRKIVLQSGKGKYMNYQMPQNLDVKCASLPETYENAKKALAACVNIDECKEWADKAEALASYAKMADDDALHRMAMRIKARAIQCCGELLKQLDGRGGDRTDSKSMVDHTSATQSFAANEAGLSKHQQVQAVRVANVPKLEFEQAIAKEKPTTVTKLAKMGTKHHDRSPDEDFKPPEGFQAATHMIGSVRRFSEFCAANNPEQIANGILPHEAKEIRSMVAEIDLWLDVFVINIRNK